MTESKYGKYIVTELKAPEMDPEKAASYAAFAKRILWMDDKVVDGAFQMNCAWYFHANQSPTPERHWHDCDEIIGFFSGDPANPHDLGGEIEFWLEDERHMITKSCLIFVPKELRHCPLIIRRVDRPIFHFSTVTGHRWTPIKDE